MWLVSKIIPRKDSDVSSMLVVRGTPDSAHKDTNVAGFAKTILKGTFCILRNINVGPQGEQAVDRRHF